MSDKVFIIDASVGLKWFIPEDYSELAIEILKSLEDPHVKLYAPELFRIEFVNAIRKYLVRKIINKELAKEILAEIEKVPIIYESITWDRLRNSLEYALERKITVYDALYIILAREVNGKFITADKKLYTAVADDPHVIFIGEIGNVL